MKHLGPCLVLALSGAHAAQDVGHPGPDFTGVDGSPTQSEPQSRLWHHDGTWWGSLWSTAGAAFHIHRLDQDTASWEDTGVLVDARPKSRSDVLAAGDTLYVGTHQFTSGAGNPGPTIDLLRYSYDDAGRTYALDAGFPVTIAAFDTETLVIERDSTGTLWAVWMFDLRVRVSHTLGADDVWSEPFVLPGNTTDVTADDIAAVIAFGGDRLGVLWTDQAAGALRFAVHADGDAPGDWSAPETALGGPADDQVNLAATSDGRVLAVVRTGAGEVRLLVRDGGGWSDHLVSEAASNHGSPIVLLDEGADRLHVFATRFGTTVEKTTALGDIAFDPGFGTVVLRDDDARGIEDATSTKQNVSEATGLVVLTHNEDTLVYWSHVVPGENEPPPPPPPAGEIDLAGPVPGEVGKMNHWTVTGASNHRYVLYFIAEERGDFVFFTERCDEGIPTGLVDVRPFGLNVAHGGKSRIHRRVPLFLMGRTLHFQAIDLFTCRISNVTSVTF